MLRNYFKKAVVMFISFVMLTGIFPNFSVSAEDVNNLQPVDSTYAFIKSLEGYSSECFWDVAQWTIGYGNKCPYTHTSNGIRGQKGGHTISEAQAREMFSSKLSGYVSTLKSNCKGLSMTQNQFDALLSATYNHGNVNNCPLKYYLQGNLTESEARTQYYEWCINAGTADEKGLRNRRKKEADMFFSNPDPIPPSTPHPQISKGLYSADEIVEVTWNATENTTHYWLHTYKDGEDFESTDMYNNLSYARTYPAGNYTLYIASYNNYGETHDCVEFTVYDSVPKSPEPKIEKSLYSSNEAVTITWNDTANTTHYWLHTYIDGEDFENADMYNNLSYSRTYPAGNYTLYISSYNNYGETHDCVEFTVYDSVPKSPEPKIEKSLYSSNEAVTITWNDTANTTHYWLHTYKDGEDFENTDMYNNLSYSRIYPAGNYTLYISSYNNYGETHDCVEFTVYDTVPGKPAPKVIKDIYYSNETVEITWDEIANTDCYWMHIYRNGEEYINQTLNKDLSYSAQYPLGNYTVYIAACNGMGETVSNIKFSVIESGDVNADGQFTVADAVLLQKWLLAVPDTQLVNWKAADLCEDGKLDVFDLCLIKRKLING